MGINLPNMVILTGAGVSAESGLTTFRDLGGLWESHRVEDVASIEGWHRNPEVVLEFYNHRRKQAFDASPNEGHVAVKEMQDRFNAKLITQNVDHLHERAGSKQVLHLHGELSKARSELDPEYIIDIGDAPIKLGDFCPKGGQMRPHIVWFGEDVPLIELARTWCSQADVVIVAGTSLMVYPAAGLLMDTPSHAEIYIVDPVKPPVYSRHNVYHIEDRGSIGLPKLVQTLKKRYQNE